MDQFNVPQIGTIATSQVALVSLLLIAVAWDLKSRRIPNLIVFLGSAFALTYHTMLASGSGTIHSLTGLAIGFICFFPFYLIKSMGAGDVKLMAMVGAFLGYPTVLYAVLYTFIAGGILAIAVSVWTRSLHRMLSNVYSIFLHSMTNTIGQGNIKVAAIHQSTGKIPYALAISAGTFAHLIISYSCYSTSF